MLIPLLKKLRQRDDLTAQECYQALDSMRQQFVPEQAAALLSLLSAKSETSHELGAFVDYFKQQMIHVRSHTATLDIVGTGADGSNSINISSATSLVTASLGVTTAKHGNRSISSRCGSADFMAKLGIDINLNAIQAANALQQHHFAFLYAPNFHPVLGHFKALRKILGIPTIFNLMGPLLNPSEPDYLLLGVYHPKLLPIYADLLAQTDIAHALIVHSCGLDEASLLGITEVIEVKAGQQQYYQLDPQRFGFTPCHLSDLQGNEQLILAAFRGESGAVANTISLNAGCALYASGTCDSIDAGVTMAKNQLAAGNVINFLEKLTGKINHA